MPGEIFASKIVHASQDHDAPPPSVAREWSKQGGEVSSPTANLCINGLVGAVLLFRSNVLRPNLWLDGLIED